MKFNRICLLALLLALTLFTLSCAEAKKDIVVIDNLGVEREEITVEYIPAPAPEPIEVEEIVEPVVIFGDEPIALEEDISEEVEWPKLYTEEDAIALAKMVWGEARGVPPIETEYGQISSKSQQAATIWCVLNRYDAGFEDTIEGVVKASGQFHGYKPGYPVKEEFLELAYDVLDRWNREKHGEIDVGRTLPSDYLFFACKGRTNRFRQEYRSREYWDWSYGDPYAENIEEE